MKKIKLSLIVSILLTLNIVNTAFANITIEMNTNQNQNSFNNSFNNVDKIGNLENVTINEFGCSSDINKLLSQIEYILGLYENDKDYIYLEKLMDLFGEIGSKALEVDLQHFENSESYVSKYFYNIRDYIYAIESKSVKENYIIKFSKEILFGWRKNKIAIIYPEIYLVENLVDYNGEYFPMSDIQEELDYIKSSYHYMINIQEQNSDSEELPQLEDTIIGDSSPIIPDYELEFGGNGNGNSNENGNSNGSNMNDITLNNESINTNEDTITHSSFYKRKGNSCVLIKQEYKNGQLIRENETSVSKDEYVFCGINDNIFPDINNDKDNKNDSIIVDPEQIEYEENYSDSNYYIYYTLTKSSAAPYYHNSGIKASINKTINYTQFVNAVYQLAVKMNASSIVESDKSLFIMDGKPVLIRNNKTFYYDVDVEELLKDFKDIGLSILEEKESFDNDLVNIIGNKKFITLNYKGNDYTLSSVYINDDLVMVSIKELVEYFDYNVKVNNNKILITKEDYKLEINTEDGTYILNDEKGEEILKLKSRNNEWSISLDKIMELINYSIKWDSEDSCFYVD